MLDVNEIAPFLTLGLILDLLSINSNFQILQDTPLLEWGWESPEVVKYLIPTIETDQEQVRFHPIEVFVHTNSIN